MRCNLRKWVLPLGWLPSDAHLLLVTKSYLIPSFSAFLRFSASSPLSLLLVCSLLKMTKNHFAMSWGKGEKLSKRNKSLWDSKAWMPCSQPDLLWNVTAVQNCIRNTFLWDQLLEHSVSKTFKKTENIQRSEPEQNIRLKTGLSFL